MHLILAQSVKFRVRVKTTVSMSSNDFEKKPPSLKLPSQPSL